MATNVLKVIKNSVKHWYLPLITGILFIAVGILVFTTPAESYVVLSVIFSFSFLITGAFDIFFSISNRNEMEGWGWDLSLGILSLLVGILMLIHPEISMVTLPFFVGFVLLFRSIMAIGVSLELRNYYILDWGYLLAIGIIGTMFSLILLWNPAFAGLSLVMWTALAFIALGAFSIYLSLKLKKLHDIPKTISSELKEKYNQVKDDVQKHIMNTINEMKTNKQ
jgi:uncharacterized membrane protein HdeD (DUF308 family)